MSFEGFALGCIGIVVGVLIFYVLVRVASSAFFISKHEQERRNKNG